MARQSYWEQVRFHRVSRRRALIAGASVSGGLALSLACGGDGDTDNGEGASGLLSEPRDTTSQAKRGGTYEHVISSDPRNLDPLSGLNLTPSAPPSYVYSRLLKFKPGVLQPATGEVEGDVADSYELFDGGTRIVFKLRSNMLLDQRPPTSGRAVDAEDVLFSYQKFSANNPRRGDLSTAARPTAPVESMQNPDKSTIVVRLARPYAPIIPLFASGFHLWVVPREADSMFDPRAEARGSGPWTLERHQPDVAIEYRRNPNWYRKDRPFFEGWTSTIISEYSQQVAQFRAGRIWPSVLRQEDILSTKRDLQQLLLFKQHGFNTSLPHVMYGFAEGSPFRDERVRQAFSMLLERDLFLDTFNNVPEFTNAGLKVNMRWPAHMAVGWDGYWLNPDDKDFGENSKYLRHNPGEAKKLLEAAGFSSGVDTECFFSGGTFYGADYGRRVAAVVGMAAEGGFRIKMSPLDHVSDYLPNFALAAKRYGNYKGLSFATGGAQVDPGIWMSLYYHTDGSTFHLDHKDNTELDRLVELQLQEFDQNKRFAIFHDIQRRLAKSQLITPFQGDTERFQLTWPWVGNYNVHQTWVGAAPAASETAIHLWDDASKRTS